MYALYGIQDSNDGFHECCKLDVSLTETSAVVSRKGDFYPVVDVEPLGMVVHLVCLEGDTGHETEGSVEVLEDKLFLDGVAARLVHFPALVKDRSEGRLTLTLREFGRSPSHISSANN